jgi:outer membrane biosynthesis protein TonB
MDLQDQKAILGGKAANSSASSETKKPHKETPVPTPAQKATPAPTATPVPTATPAAVDPDDLAIGRATPTPALPPVPTPAAPSGGGTYQPETRATRMEGSLSNRGRPSIAARGTPLGKYLRQVENAIGSRWYFYIKLDAAFVAPGAVRIIFTIDRSGKAGGLRVLANTSNESFASTCTQSIMDAEFPPIPDEVASTLYTQRLELPFTFTIY